MATKEQELHNKIQRMDNSSPAFDLDLLDILIRLNSRVGALEAQVEKLNAIDRL